MVNDQGLTSEQEQPEAKEPDHQEHIQVKLSDLVKLSGQSFSGVEVGVIVEQLRGKPIPEIIDALDDLAQSPSARVTITLALLLDAIQRPLDGPGRPKKLELGDVITWQDVEHDAWPLRCKVKDCDGDVWTLYSDGWGMSNDSERVDLAHVVRTYPPVTVVSWGGE